MFNIPPKNVAIEGYTLRSPCKICPIHIHGMNKLKNDFCKSCKITGHYDDIIKTGNCYYPFISDEILSVMENIETDMK